MRDTVWPIKRCLLSLLNHFILLFQEIMCFYAVLVSILHISLTGSRLIPQEFTVQLVEDKEGRLCSVLLAGMQRSHWKIDQIQVLKMSIQKSVHS